MKEIELTQGQVAKVDDWNYDWLNQWEWCAAWNKGTKSFYAIRAEYKPFKKTIRMHREIMKTPVKMHCDHEDHDTLNNQEYNLRNATPSQNQMNKIVQSNSPLGERCIVPHGNGFRVRVHKDEKKVFDKTYRTLEDAVIARDEAVKIYHGDFAYHD